MKENKRTEQIHIRLSPEEKRKIQEFADKERRTVSDYIVLIATREIK